MERGDDVVTLVVGDDGASDLGALIGDSDLGRDDYASGLISYCADNRAEALGFGGGYEEDWKDDEGEEQPTG